MWKCHKSSPSTEPKYEDNDTKNNTDNQEQSNSVSSLPTLDDFNYESDKETQNMPLSVSRFDWNKKKIKKQLQLIGVGKEMTNNMYRY